MASAVKLVIAGPTTVIDVLGVAIEGIRIEPRTVKRRVTSFFGVNGESHIFGGYAGRSISIPVIIYDSATLTTADSVGVFLNTLNSTKLGLTGTLQVTSESDHPDFTNCTFDGFVLEEGPKHDEAGTLGGGWFAIGVLLFRQMD